MRNLLGKPTAELRNRNNNKQRNLLYSPALWMLIGIGSIIAISIAYELLPKYWSKPRAKAINIRQQPSPESPPQSTPIPTQTPKLTQTPSELESALQNYEESYTITIERGDYIGKIATELKKELNLNRSTIETKLHQLLEENNQEFLQPKDIISIKNNQLKYSPFIR